MCRVLRALGRPRSACTARPTCSTPTVEQLSRGVLVVGPNASFLRYIARRASGARRDRREADDDRGACRRHPRPALAPQRHPRRRHRGRRHPQGRRADGRGAGAGAVVARRHADRGPGRPTRRAPMAGRDVRDRRGDRRPPAPRRPVRRRADDAARSRLAHRILVKMELAGDAPDDRVQDAVARSKPVKDYVNAIWPAVDPRRLLWRLLSEPAFLADAAGGDPRPRRAGRSALAEARRAPRA